MEGAGSHSRGVHLEMKAAMRPRHLFGAACVLLLTTPRVRSEAQGLVTPALSGALQQKAGRYLLKNVAILAHDSAFLVFQDSALTADGLRAHTWMFGPKVSEAEADGCPPEKVLGRKIARLFWRRLGKGQGMQLVVVRVEGTKGIDKLTRYDMYYFPAQLQGRWAGDPDPD